MVDHDIQHLAAQINNRIQLFARLLGRMAHFKEAFRLVRHLQHITAGSRKDRVSLGTQKRDILHHHLTAHADCPPQRPAGKRCG